MNVNAQDLSTMLNIYKQELADAKEQSIIFKALLERSEKEKEELLQKIKELENVDERTDE